MTIQLAFEIGKLYTVPFADGVVHGILEEVKMEGTHLMFKIKPPSERMAIWKTIELPRKL